MKPTTITGQITAQIFELLKQHPEGISWSNLNRMIETANPTFHPKTINGTVWKLTEKYPDQIQKTDGLFQLINKS